MPRKRITVLPAPAAPVVSVHDTDGDEFVLDFGHPALAARTAEESAEHRALEARKGLAAAQAYCAAAVDGRDAERAARVAAAKTA